MTTKQEDLLNQVGTSVKAFRDELDEMKGEQKDALTEEKVRKIAEDSAKSLAEAQAEDRKKQFDAIEEERKAADERFDDLVKSLAKSGAVSEKSADSKAYYRAMNTGLRMKSREVMPEHREMFKFEVAKTISRKMPHLDDAALEEVVTKTFNAAVGPDGGYWVPVDRQDAVERRMFETSPIRELATVTTTTSNMVERVINDNEILATWGSEKSPIVNADTPQISVEKFDVHDLRTRPLITETMLEDSTVDIVGEVTAQADDRFMRQQNTAFVRGTGSQQPKGYLSYTTHTEAAASSVGNDPYVRGELGIHNSGIANNFDADGIIRFHSLLKEMYRPNAVWMMQRATWYSALQLKGTDGHYLLSAFQLANNAEFRLLGDRVVMAQDMDAVGGNTVPIAHGDFGTGYLIADRIGMTVLVDPFSEDPFIRYRFRMRVGGGVKNFEAIKLFRMAV